MAELTGAETDKLMRDLMKGVTGDEFRAIAIEGLRRGKREYLEKDVEWSMNGYVGRAIVPVLVEHAGKTATPQIVQALKEVFFYAQGDPDMQPWTDFIAWFIRAGFAFPVYRSDNHGYPSAIRLTSAGRRFLDADQDHPYLPGHLDRVLRSCPKLPDDVGVLLADAQTCADNGLGRPAVILAGVAYEVARDTAAEELEAAGKLPPKKGRRAAQQIVDVKAILPVLFADLEERGRALAAWDFADRLRDRRNQGSHPGRYPDFSDPGEVHDYLLSAGRHLPGLWSVTTV